MPCRDPCKSFFGYKLIGLVYKLVVFFLFQTSVASVDLKKTVSQPTMFELILRTHSSCVCLCVCGGCMHVCACARCISAEFYSNREHEFYITVVCLSIHDFAFSLFLAGTTVLVYSDVSSVQLEACLLARFRVYYNLCDVQK